MMGRHLIPRTEQSITVDVKDDENSIVIGDNESEDEGIAKPSVTMLDWHEKKAPPIPHPRKSIYNFPRTFSIGTRIRRPIIIEAPNSAFHTQSPSFL
jgi:hypothetical protein